MEVHDKGMFRKRPIIETIFDYLKNKFNLQHKRHKSPINFLIHILSIVILYQFKRIKSSISFGKNLAICA